MGEASCMAKGNRSPRAVEEYLEFLGVSDAVVSVRDLQRLVVAQVTRVPYEVVSKFAYAPGQVEAINGCIPSLDVFVRNLRTRGFGGNCYILTINFSRLLRAIGFAAHLVAVDPGHVGVVADLSDCEGGSWCVDVGYGSPLDCPVPLAQVDKQPLDIQRFGETLRFTRTSCVSIELNRIYAGQSFVRKTIRLEPMMEADFARAIETSWRDDADNRFMRRMSLAKVAADRYVWVRDATLTTRTNGGEMIETFADASAWFDRICGEFHLHASDVWAAHRFLGARGADFGWAGVAASGQGG